MKYICFAFFMYLSAGALQAQDSTAVRRDTTITPATTDASATDLLAGLSDSTETKPELLPHKMIFTQRAFWGPKGLLRSMKIAPLTPDGRAHELKVRRTMLIAHQIGGFVTLAGFIAQGIIGAKLYNAKGQDYVDTKKWHERSATFINVTYGTTLLLSLTAPPPVVGARKGFTTIKLHKYLAIVHLTGMVATNVLAHMIDENASLKPYHRAAAYTTFGAYAASILAITF
ncbi:hypothetical protein GCM10028819_05730 [Spirosoma humi]